MAETFYTLIARNKRNSFILVSCFLVLFVILGLLIGNVWSGGDVYFSVGVAVIAGIIAFLFFLVSYFGGSSVLLGISHAMPVSKADDPQLYNVVEELSLAGGLPVPKIYIIEESAMNAFATGRDPKHAVVAITRGLRERLSREELQGVMAHELSHVRHYDILFGMMMAVMVGVLVMLSDLFLRSMWYGGNRRSRRRGGQGGGAAMLVLLIVTIVLAILAPILAKIIQLALSRQREYMSDAGAVELTRNPLGLAGALTKLSSDTQVLETASRATAPLYIVNPLKGRPKRATSLFSTHPDIQDRIQRLMNLV